jgi:hypothetical protein
MYTKLPMSSCYISSKRYRRSDSIDSLHESIKSRVTEGRSALAVNEINALYFKTKIQRR